VLDQGGAGGCNGSGWALLSGTVGSGGEGSLGGWQGWWQAGGVSEAEAGRERRRRSGMQSWARLYQGEGKMRTVKEEFGLASYRQGKN
jgi:hypothetical protein